MTAFKTITGIFFLLLVSLTINAQTTDTEQQAKKIMAQTEEQSRQIQQQAQQQVQLLQQQIQTQVQELQKHASQQMNQWQTETNQLSSKAKKNDQPLIQQQFLLKAQQLQIRIQQQLNLIRSLVELNIQHAIQEAEFRVKSLQLQASQQVFDLSK
jgi:hypothetical protein